MAFIPQVTDQNFNAQGLKKLELDAVIDSDFVGVIDLIDPNSWVSQANPTPSDTVKNLVDGVADSTLGSGIGTIAFDQTKGFTGFNINGPQSIILPDDYKLAGSAGFAFCTWFLPLVQTQAAAGNISGYFDGANKEGPWGIYFENPAYYILINSQQIATGVPNNAYSQLVGAWVPNGDGAYNAVVYRNGVVETSVSATYNTLQLPTQTVPPTATLGDSSGNGMNDWPNMSLGRNWVTQLKTDGTARATLDELVAYDYAENSDRFLS